MKFSNILESLLSGILKGIDAVDARIQDKIENTRKKQMRCLLEFVIILMSVAFVITGAIIFFSRFFSLDLIFLVIGFIGLYTFIIMRATK